MDATIVSSEWRVELVGDLSDLSALAQSLNGKDVNISHDGQNYILTSEAFAPGMGANVVREKAKSIVDLLNGAARLALESNKAIHLGSIYRILENGTREINVVAETALMFLHAVAATVRITRADGTVEDFHPAQPVKAWLSLAAKSEPVARVFLLLASGPLDWVNLYRIFEIIAKDTGGLDAIASAGWTTKKSMKLFKHTANSPTALGLEARHGEEATAPPQKPMTISEARSLIISLIHAWLRSMSTTP